MTPKEANELISACMAPIQWEHHTGGEWQFYVGDQTRRVWDTMTFNQRLAIAMDAHAVLMKSLTAAGQDYG